MTTDTETPPKTTPQATKPVTDAKTPAKTAPRATRTKTPANTARRAAGTKSPRKPASRATKPVTDTKGPAKSAPRVSKPVSGALDVERALKQWTETARKATENTVELYVKSVDQLATAEVKAARATKLPIVATIAETNAAVSRQIASAYVAGVRELLRA